MLGVLVSAGLEGTRWKRRKVVFVKLLVQHTLVHRDGGSLLPKAGELLRKKPPFLEKPSWPLPKDRKRKDQ